MTSWAEQVDALLSIAAELEAAGLPRLSATLHAAADSLMAIEDAQDAA